MRYQFRGETKALAETIQAVIEDMRDYWPLTVRQVYYQCVASLAIKNAHGEYRRVSEVLANLRRDGTVPWYAIEDRTRTTVPGGGYTAVGDFIEGQIASFMDPEYYHRNYVHDQDVYVEVVVEKDALASVIGDAVRPFRTCTNIAKGQASATLVNDIAERLEVAVAFGKRPILICFGDLDPSGVAIPKTLQNNLYKYHNLEVEVVRAALNPDQVALYNLPVSPDAAKEKDPNHGAWVKEFGDQAPTELDAIHPRDLAALTREALESVYDMDRFKAQQAQEAAEREMLGGMRREVEAFIAEKWPEFGGAA